MNLLKFKFNNYLFYKNLKNLKNTPRNKLGYFKFLNYLVKYTDSLSLYHEYKDIFENNIYFFNSYNKKPVIIDGGSCVGMSVLFFKHIYPNSKILSFEPDPSIFKILKENIISNNLKDISTFNVGLGKNNSCINFYSDGSDGGSFNNINKVDPVKVNIVKLSDYINEPIDLLKLNIEGLEADVFEEIEPKIGLIKEIIFEYHAFYNLEQSLGKILNILDRNGFRYLVTDATNSKIKVPFNLVNNYKNFNLVYAKKF